MVRKQMGRVDAIVCQFHNMFTNAYQVISEEELNHIKIIVMKLGNGMRAISFKEP